MNEELRLIALQAGAPREVINELWFHVFCQRFAHLIIGEAEVEMTTIKSRLDKVEAQS
jgi:hypothetical protein